MFTALRKIAAKVTTFLGGTIFVCCTYHCITEYFVDLAVCSGSSMEPTLYDKDILVIRRYISNSTDVKKGDILVVKNPSDPRKYWCKRLVGLPGDRISSGYFYDVIPMGHIWLEGDNSAQSHDSRNIGPVPQGLIQGKALFTLWPFLRDLRKTSYFKIV